jgi:4'-phosphopantetheinyl transferase
MTSEQPPPQCPARLELRSDEIHVVHVRLDEPVDDAPTLLDEGERARAARFVFERDRRRFVAAHVWTRVLLARAVGCPAASLRFAVGASGKPRLSENPLDLRFNLTHAGERALVALTLGREVGIDIEEHRSIEALDLASRVFARGEIAALAALSPPDRLAAFYRGWTMKEAFVKARGDGLAYPLDSFDVSLVDGETSQIVREDADGLRGPRAWRIVPLPIEPGYTAALAAEAGEWRIVRWRAA